MKSTFLGKKLYSTYRDHPQIAPNGHFDFDNDHSKFGKADNILDMTDTRDSADLKASST